MRARERERRERERKRETKSTRTNEVYRNSDTQHTPERTENEALRILFYSCFNINTLVHIYTIILSSASVRKITIPAKRRERFVHAPERGKKDGKFKRSRGRYE